MTEVAAADGLEFHFDRARSGSTFDAHRLTHLAAAHGLQDAMEERLMRAYLTDGELISDHPTLARLAGEAGLPDDDARDVLGTDRYAGAVRDDERTAASLEITAVPFFVIDRAIGVPGAQPPELLVKALERAWKARRPLTVVKGGEACGPEGC
jgi:predicted DsbA family dithiol-disulfide isomerase